ncbi:MAG: hypothetical protein AAFW70_26455 [Cyanobacteria bacterium J06635_10]
MTNNLYTGRVLNGENKTFIDSAKVTLELDGKSYIVHSDSEGYYQFNADLNGDTASARMRVEAEGCEKYNRNIMLSTEDNKIEEIHLTPSKNKLKVSLDKAAAIATVIGTAIAIFSYISGNPVTSEQIDSGKSESPQLPSQEFPKQSCDPAYPDLCIPKDSPNLNCSDIGKHNFKVLPPDPHGFDRNSNGVGCEKK